MNRYASFTVDYQFGKKRNILKNNTSNDALIVSRNADWMQKPPPLLEEQNCFIRKYWPPLQQLRADRTAAETGIYGGAG